MIFQCKFYSLESTLVTVTINLITFHQISSFLDNQQQKGRVLLFAFTILYRLNE